MIVEIILIIILLIVLFYICIHPKKETLEHYWDIIPYKYHWNIFKCYNDNCIRDESNKCYKWCDNWEEPAAKHNCRMRCIDYSDIMLEQYKFNHYTFNRNMPKFDEYSLLRNTDYF